MLRYFDERIMVTFLIYFNFKTSLLKNVTKILQRKITRWIIIIRKESLFLLHEKGDKTIFSNYRVIALQDTMYKILPTVIQNIDYTLHKKRKSTSNIVY